MPLLMQASKRLIFLYNSTDRRYALPIPNRARSNAPSCNNSSLYTTCPPNIPWALRAPTNKAERKRNRSASRHVQERLAQRLLAVSPCSLGLNHVGRLAEPAEVSHHSLIKRDMLMKTQAWSLHQNHERHRCRASSTHYAASGFRGLKTVRSLDMGATSKLELTASVLPSLSRLRPKPRG